MPIVRRFHRSSYRGWTFWTRAALLLTLTVVLAAGCAGDDADPADVLQAYVDAYNVHDLDGVVAVFAEDAVVTGHPLDGRNSRATGLEEIRDLESRDMSLSVATDAYEMTDVEVSGNRVSFGHIIHHRSGACFAGAGHSLVVEGDKIVRWDWGTPRTCP